MLPSFRSPVRERRWLALVLALLLGIGSAATASLSLGRPLLLVALALGAGTSTYYVTYYGHRFPPNEPVTRRAFVQRFAMILLVFLVTGDPSEHGLVPFLWMTLTVACLADVVAKTAQLEVLDA
ncbi:hypothetical protein [Haloarchaeobius sp. DT45]|uniref:hypothetical protein n=1 Tax=Haloarchaeobius sp. DT45 TaxID=3446116 RepID=UPI003F6D3A01